MQSSMIKLQYIVHRAMKVKNKKMYALPFELEQFEPKLFPLDWHPWAH